MKMSSGEDEKKELCREKKIKVGKLFIISFLLFNTKPEAGYENFQGVTLVVINQNLQVLAPKHF